MLNEQIFIRLGPKPKPIQTPRETFTATDQNTTSSGILDDGNLSTAAHSKAFSSQFQKHSGDVGVDNMDDAEDDEALAESDRDVVGEAPQIIGKPYANSSNQTAGDKANSGPANTTVQDDGAKKPPLHLDEPDWPLVILGLLPIILEAISMAPTLFRGRLGTQFGSLVRFLRVVEVLELFTSMVGVFLLYLRNRAVGHKVPRGCGCLCDCACLPWSLVVLQPLDFFITSGPSILSSFRPTESQPRDVLEIPEPSFALDQVIAYFFMMVANVAFGAYWLWLLKKQDGGLCVGRAVGVDEERPIGYPCLPTVQGKIATYE